MSKIVPYIVEMQLGHYKHFIQRSKFYAFHRFNTLVAKGDFKFKNLPPIYCIGLLAKGIFPASNHYYHFARLTNQKGEVLDDQITHIIVEINKFKKEARQVQSDLDKLIYIMKHLKNIHNGDNVPKFLSEEWIVRAMEKLDKTKMTPEQRMHYEMTRAKNASTLQMREEELKEALKEGHEKGREEGREETLKATAKKLKDLGISYDIITQTTGLSPEIIQHL